MNWATIFVYVECHIKSNYLHRRGSNDSSFFLTFRLCGRGLELSSNLFPCSKRSRNSRDWKTEDKNLFFLPIFLYRGKGLTGYLDSGADSGFRLGGGGARIWRKKESKFRRKSFENRYKICAHSAYFFLPPPLGSFSQFLFLILYF